LLELALRIELLPLIESIGDDEAALPAPPRVLERRLGGELLRPRVEGRVGELVVFGPVRDQASFHHLGNALATDRADRNQHRHGRRLVVVDLIVRRAGIAIIETFDPRAPRRVTFGERAFMFSI
jgi:hypothetical protein